MNRFREMSLPIFIVILFFGIVVSCAADPSISIQVEGTPLPKPTPVATNTPLSEIERALPPSTAIPIVDQEAASPSTPLVVNLAMSKAPKVDEPVTVIMSIQVFEEMPEVTAEFELSENAEFLAGGNNWSGTVLPEQPIELTAEVVFTAVGEYKVTGRALSDAFEGIVWADTKEIFLTVGDEQGSFGITSGDEPLVTAVPVP